MIEIHTPSTYFNNYMIEECIATDALSIKKAIDNKEDFGIIVHQFGELHQRINSPYSIIEAHKQADMDRKYIAPLRRDLQSLVEEAKDKCKFIISEFMKGNKTNQLSTDYDKWSIVASFSVNDGEVDEATRRAMQDCFYTIANFLK